MQAEHTFIGVNVLSPLLTSFAENTASSLLEGISKTLPALPGYDSDSDVFNMNYFQDSGQEECLILEVAGDQTYLKSAVVPCQEDVINSSDARPSSGSQTNSSSESDDQMVPLERYNVTNSESDSAREIQTGHFSNNKMTPKNPLEKGGNLYSEEWSKSQDIVCYIKERDSARAETATTKAELSATQIKLYDMAKTIEKLEKQLIIQNGSKSPLKVPKKGKKAPVGNTLEIPRSRGVPQSPRRSPTRNSSRSSSRSPSRKDASNIRKKAKTKTAIVNVIDQNREDFYRAIAEQFPSLPLSVVLMAEDKFRTADINNDGTIDRYELDTVLMANNFLLTPSQIDDMLRDMDVDNSQSVDIFEVLSVLDKLERRRRAPVPKYIQDKKSQICVIQ